MVSGNDIFEGEFKFSASEARKKHYSTYSEDQVAIGEQLGSDRGVIGERVIEQSLTIYEK